MGEPELDVPRHFKVEPQYIWNVLQFPAEAVMASWEATTARMVVTATMMKYGDVLKRNVREF